MTQSWRIPINIDDWMRQVEKRLMRQERRPSITNATQILGPGAGPYAVLLNDWNEEAATFNGVFYSEAQSPGVLNNSPDETSAWMGETFGTEDGFGIQRLTRFRVSADVAGAAPVSWEEYHRRFFLAGDQYSYTAWEAV